MGYDLHFEDGRHEWHNIWVVETTVLLIAYAEGKIKRQELLDSLATMAMSKADAEGTSQGEPDDVGKGKKKIKREKSGRPQADYLIHITTFDPEEIDDLSDVIFNDLKNKKVKKVYGAKIIPKNEEAIKRMSEIKEDLTAQLLPMIGWRERMDEHKELLNDPQIDAMFDNDGRILSSQTCALMLVAFMKLDSKLLDEVDEYYPMGEVVRLIGHCAYSAGSGYSITVR